jgi:hypothetical protein
MDRGFVRMGMSTLRMTELSAKSVSRAIQHFRWERTEGAKLPLHS